MSTRPHRSCTASSAMSTCFMAGFLRTRPRARRPRGNFPQGQTLLANTKSRLSARTIWNSAQPEPRRHNWKRPCDLSSPPDRESGLSWYRRIRRRPLKSNSPKSAIASYSFDRAMWSLCTLNSNRYSGCPAPHLCNGVPMAHLCHRLFMSETRGATGGLRRSV